MGSNLAGPERHLARAVQELGRLLESVRVAPLFASAAVSSIRQPDFLNTALVGVTGLGPSELLGLLKSLEFHAGRRTGPRDGPRVLDVDLLLWGETVLDRPELTVPHPRLRERTFVLAPLARIAADWRVPPDGRHVRDLLSDLGSDQSVSECAWSQHPLV